MMLLFQTAGSLSAARFIWRSEFYFQLEEGEIDVRLNSFKGCFIQRASRQRPWRQTLLQFAKSIWKGHAWKEENWWSTVTPDTYDKFQTEILLFK